jgi:rhamnogalacturonyl hydrolase YesR
MLKVSRTIFLAMAFIAFGICMVQAQKKRSIYSAEFISHQVKNVCDWQLANPVEINVRNENDWARAAFYTGVMATYQTTKDRKYLDAAISWSESFNWKLAARLRHADDHAKGQVYLEIYEIEKDPAMFADIKNTFDSLIANPRKGRDDWWWCDALFMAPPVLAKLAAATGEEKYQKYLNEMFWDTHDFLYDKADHLFYRDRNFFNKKTPNGSKTFWGRGNGWVIAGIVRVLQHLPKDNERYNDYVTLFHEMAASIKKVQGKDGLWRPSLLDKKEVPHPETSASSFFCYAMAWGINNNLLDRKGYLPVVKKSWKGLNELVTDEGKLQWVQPIGGSPEKVTIDNYQEYGSGAFLLAGSEVYKMK